MHPGQYTILNSPHPQVVHNAVADLKYHAEFLDALAAGPESKIILHLGGIYGDKKRAIRSFKENYLRLPEKIKRRLALENDDSNYNLEEVLIISGTWESRWYLTICTINSTRRRAAWMS